MPAHIHLEGQKFGLLTVLSYIGGSKWSCACECGGSTVAATGNLRNGNTKSCGCRKRSVLGESTTKHGMHGTNTYRSWKAMRNRCNNPNTPRYKDYGGRGIKVCARWAQFENFLVDMGERPEGMTLDRINVDGNYEPGNCRWATPTTQGLETRTTRKLEHNGVVRSLSEWARLAGHSPSWLHKKLKQMSLDDALADVVTGEK